MKTENLLIAGGIVLAAILILKDKKGTSLAGDIGKATGEALGETAGGLVVGTTKGFVNTVAPRNITTGFYNWAHIDQLKEGALWVKRLGNDESWWS